MQKSPIFITENVEEFWADASSELLKDEPRNSLLLGLALREKNRTKPPEHKPLFFVFREGPHRGYVGSGLFGSGIPNLVLSDAPKEHLLLALATEMQSRNIKPQAICAPIDTAEKMATIWCKRNGIEPRIGMKQGMYACKHVVFPERMPAGRKDLAKESESALIAEWMYAFAREAIPFEGHLREKYDEIAKARIELSEIHVWRDQNDRAVCMVANSRPTPNGMTVNLVYTPEESRGKGFASALTAAVTQEMLSSGRKFVTLYTDLTNGTSNRVYKKIGYELIGGARHYLVSAK